MPLKICQSSASAGLTPMIILNPVGSAFQLTNGSLVGTLMRTDIHQVIVGLALPASTGGKHDLNSQQPRPHFPLLVTASAPTQSGTGEVAALEAVNNQIIRFQVPKSLIVTP